MKKTKKKTKSKPTKRDDEIAKAWVDVVNRRVKNFLAGKAKTTPWEKVLADLRARHGGNQARRRKNMTVVPASQARRNLSKVLDKVTDEKPVLITRRGGDLAVLVSPDWYVEHVAPRTDARRRKRRAGR